MEDLITLMSLVRRVDIFYDEPFKDSRGRYFGRYTLDVAPFGKSEHRYYGDDLPTLIVEALAEEIREQAKRYETPLCAIEFMGGAICVLPVGHSGGHSSGE